jgi:hypothetical protein
MGAGISGSFNWKFRFFISPLIIRFTVRSIHAGKSCCISHIIDVRVDPESSTLVTALHPPTLRALLPKLLKHPTLSTKLLILGQPTDFGPSAERFQLDNLMQNSELPDAGGRGFLEVPEGFVAKGWAGKNLAKWSWRSLAFLLWRMAVITKRDVANAELVCHRCQRSLLPHGYLYGTILSLNIQEPAHLGQCLWLAALD